MANRKRHCQGTDPTHRSDLSHHRAAQMRAVEGYSMGGYGAAHSASSIRKFLALSASWRGADHPQRHRPARRVRQMFGSDPAACRPTVLSSWCGRTPTPPRPHHCSGRCGRSDGLPIRDRAFHELLRQLKIGHDYELVLVPHNDALFTRR